MKGFILAVGPKPHFSALKIQVAAAKKPSMNTLKATNLIKVFLLLLMSISQISLNNGPKVMSLIRKVK